MATKFEIMDGPWKKGELREVSIGFSVKRDMVSIINDCTEIAYVPVDYWANERQLANVEAIASLPNLIDALKEILNKYETLAASGDAGLWHWEKESEVIKAHQALESTKSFFSYLEDDCFTSLDTYENDCFTSEVTHELDKKFWKKVC